MGLSQALDFEGIAVKAEWQMKKKMDQQPFSLQPSAFSPTAGFSLFELLAVLVIVALGAALVAPATGRMLAKVSFRQDVLAIKKELRGIQSRAVSSGQPLWLRLDGLTLEVSRPGAEEPLLRTLDVDDESELTMTPELVHFSPLGTASPATLVLNWRERQRTIRLDALTGLPQ